MHLSFIIAATLLQLISALQLGTRQCLVDIEVVRNNKAYAPTVATSYNLSEILKRMRECQINTVQVAGWDNHVGVYVVYSNGAVVPAVPQDLPNVALYTKMCGNSVKEFVFVTENCKCPENPSLNPEPVCCYEQPDVIACQPIRWNHNSGFVNCEESSADQDCFPMPLECSRRRKCHNSRKSEIVQYTAVYRFADRLIDEKLTKVLIAETRAEKNSKTVYNLKKSKNLPVKILKDYKYLKMVYYKAMDLFPGGCCLYVNNSSDIFVLSDDELYRILGKDDPYFKKLNMKEKTKAIKLGLQLVILD